MRESERERDDRRCGAHFYALLWVSVIVVDSASRGGDCCAMQVATPQDFVDPSSPQSYASASARVSARESACASVSACLCASVRRAHARRALCDCASARALACACSCGDGGDDDDGSVSSCAFVGTSRVESGVSLIGPVEAAALESPPTLQTAVVAVANEWRVDY